MVAEGVVVAEVCTGAEASVAEATLVEAAALAGSPVVVEVSVAVVLLVGGNIKTEQWLRNILLQNQKSSR
ncbi:hypothetical protein MARINOS108_120087 [Marinoscillum sp. 108]|nr:hypothetical protein MARINOS108_120087 [Marinoscillum sp. 108]